jgi:hypothetical protein
LSPTGVRLEAYKFVLGALRRKLERDEEKDRIFPPVLAEIHRIEGVIAATVLALEQTAAAIK